jgi:hypothetical protein
VSVQDQAPRGTHPFAGLARAIDRAIPNPLLALPLLLLALGLLFEAAGRITGDTWFDLVSGRDIVQHGLPHSDRLMAFTAGHPWQDQQWLAHLASYGFYTVGGLPLVYLADCVLLTGGLFIAISASRSLGGTPMWIAALATPVLLIQVLSTARAQSFAMPLFALLLWLLARDARKPDRRILLVIPLLALWANLHGSVLLGCALLLLRCLVAIGIALRHRRLADLRRPLALSCIAIAAPFASPYGPALFQYYKGTATNGAFHEYVTEWAGTTLRAWPAFFVFAAVALVAVLRPEIKLRLFDSLCLVALVLAGLDTVRNIVWLPLAVVVLLPSGLAAWSPESTVRSRLRPILTTLTLAGAIGVGVLAAGLSSSKLIHPWPTAEAAVIAKRAAADPSLRILSDPGYADWLEWTYPSLRGRIAFDIRFELLGGRGLKQVVHMQQAAGPTWNKPFRGYRLTLWSKSANPELVGSLLAQPGARLISHHDDVYAILRPSVTPLGTR